MRISEILTNLFPVLTLETIWLVYLETRQTLPLILSHKKLPQLKLSKYNFEILSALWIIFNLGRRVLWRRSAKNGLNQNFFTYISFKFPNWILDSRIFLGDYEKCILNNAFEQTPRKKYAFDKFNGINLTRRKEMSGLKSFSFYSWRLWSGIFWILNIYKLYWIKIQHYVLNSTMHHTIVR